LSNKKSLTAVVCCARLRRLAPFALLVVLLLAACDTEPATDVTYSAATLNARVGCQDTTGGSAYDAQWRFAYRRVGDSGWTTRPWHSYNCPANQGPHYLPGSPFSERVDSLESSRDYEYRLEIGSGGTYVQHHDADGTKNGTNYNSFTTLAHPTVNVTVASTIRDMFGLNTRTGFGGTNFDCWGGADNDCDVVKFTTVFLGARRLRDGIHPPWHTWQHDFLDDLSATTDVKLRMGISSLPHGYPFINEELALIDGADQHETRLRNLVESFESVNEPDHDGAKPLCDDGVDNDAWDQETYAINDQLIDRNGFDSDKDGVVEPNEPQPDPGCASTTDENEAVLGQQDTPKWPQRMRLYQQRLFERVNANPLFASKPVLGPNFAHGAEAQVGDLGQWVDYGTFHPYPGNSMPGDTQISPNLSSLRDICMQYVGGKPCYATETGYHTQIDGGGGGNKGVNAHVQAIYTPRLLMESWIRGIKGIDFFVLVEQSPDSGTCTGDSDGVLDEKDWGWYDCNWNANPVVDTMHNLTQAVGDGGCYCPSTYKAAVEQQPSDLHVVYARRDDGDLSIVLWRRVPNWSTSPTPHEVTVAPQDVRISLPDATTVTKYVPSSGSSGTSVPIQSGRVTVPLTGELVVLRVH
jgi:hypothetical protein